MTAEDSTGFVFAVERRLYRNIGLDAAGHETALPWEIATTSDRSTALRPGETREERVLLPVPEVQARGLRIHATLAYRRLPTADPLAMAEASAMLVPASR